MWWLWISWGPSLSVEQLCCVELCQWSWAQGTRSSYLGQQKEEVPVSPSPTGEDQCFQHLCRWTAGHQLLPSACWWLSGKHGLHMWGLLLGRRDDHSIFPSTLATLSSYYLISLSFSFTSSNRCLHPSLGTQQNQQQQTQLFRTVLLLSLLSQLVSQFCSRKRTLSRQENSAGAWVRAASLGWEQQLLPGEGGVLSVSNLPKAHKVLSLKKWEWRG